MRLWAFSDLHLEVEGMYPDFTNFRDADVAVIPGDVINRSPARAIRWVAENIQMPAVVVGGNHEFYKGALVDGLAEAREIAADYPNVHFLENDMVVIDGVRFIGATLWTDFKLMGSEPFAMEFARIRMNDYRAISLQHEPWARLYPQETAKRHYVSRKFIETELDKPFNGTTVVVTHHCPHPLSVHERYKGDTLNAAFCSDLSEVMERWRPQLWFHGHTHDSFDYVFEGTRVVCNPRGYGTENRAFDPRLVIEI